jgi:hypothetical protein
MYTHFFAFGFLYAFEAVFKGYPVPNEWVTLFEAAARSAKLDPEKIRYAKQCVDVIVMMMEPLLE